jgi:uncharacterized protein YrrD
MSEADGILVDIISSRTINTMKWYSTVSKERYVIRNDDD